MASDAVAKRSALPLGRALLALLLLGLFVAALFIGPQSGDVSSRLHGHVERAKLLANNEAARTDAVQYVTVQWSLLQAVLIDIRCASSQRRRSSGAAALTHAAAQ